MGRWACEGVWGGGHMDRCEHVDRYGEVGTWTGGEVNHAKC